MATETAKILNEGDGVSLSSEPAKPETLTGGLGSAVDPDAVRVSGSNGVDLSGDIGDGDLLLRRRVVATEVTVEKIFGVEDEAALVVEKENENESDSALDMEKDGSEKNGGPENMNGSTDENVVVLEGKSTDEIAASMSELGEMKDITAGNDEDDDDDDDDDDVGDKNHDYCVGDFVWGKIRSHPWWPGQIYDPLDASTCAAKLKQKNRLLVAYFGDGSFSWCHPSQLRPFVEGYEEMSKQSTSKNFVYAVEKALEEISRVVESEMRFTCISEGNQTVVAKAVNAGIRAEANVPEGSIGKLLIAQYGLVELLAIVRDIARVNSFNSLLQFVVLKSWLRSFYLARGGYKLCSYSEPRYIEGLEDNKNGNPVEVPILASVEEEWIEKSSEKIPEVSDDKLYQRRKQKSVADLMKEDMDVGPKDKKQSRVKETGAASASAKKKSKVNDETGAEAEDRTVVSPSLGEKRGRKKKKKAEVSGSPSFENGGVNGEEGNEIPLSRIVKTKSGKKKMKVNDETVKEALTSPSRRKRVRKELEFSGSPKPKVSGAEKDDDVNSKEETMKSYVAREKKKSRYLSPPYTDLKRGMKNSNSKKDSETDSEKVSQIGVRMTRAASQLIGGSPSILKCTENSPANRVDSSRIESPKMAKIDQNPNSNSTEIDGNPCELLYQVRSAAVDPLCLREEKNLETITGFFSAYRDSIFINGSNYKLYNKGLSGKKRKSSLDTEPVSSELSEPVNNGSKKKKGNEVKDHKPKKIKEAANASSGCTEGSSGGIKANDKEAYSKGSPALLVTFPPGFSLPSKDVIIKKFSKFGALNKTETDVFYNSFCARLVFINSSDAEEAFNISVEKNPFGAANVNFRLRYPSSAPRDQKVSSSLKKTPENPILQSDNEASKLGFVKQKLEVITKMVENSGEKISKELKSNLESEMKELLEKVSEMMESIST